MISVLKLVGLVEGLLFLRESFKYQKDLSIIMASKDTITFVKKKTYTLPEDDWDSLDSWYDNVVSNINFISSWVRFNLSPVLRIMSSRV